MIAFQVDDMTCGHCVSTITKALQAADAGATVQVDLASHRVHVEPASASTDQLAQAIKNAGYTPVPAAVPAGRPAAAIRTGGCCGCG